MVAGAVGLQWVSDGGGVYRIGEVVTDGSHDASSVEPHPCAVWVGHRFRLDPLGDSVLEQPDPDIELVTWESPLMVWLLGRLRGPAWPLHAQPDCQPSSVHQLAGHLFSYYQVDGGHSHLVGCTLDDRPFLRLTFLVPAVAGQPVKLVHGLGTGEGELLDDELFEQLRLDQLVPMVGRRPRLEPTLLDQWTELTRREVLARNERPDLSTIAATLIWCKYASGKLAFSIGQQTVELAFEGWGCMLQDHRVPPPPFTCPLSGLSSYHLTATDDGRITVAPAIAACEFSGRRVLAIELRGMCAETRRRVLPEFLRSCPVTGRSVLESALRPCSMCRQSVSPGSIGKGRCAACRALETTTKADPRVARVLDAYPRLDRWRSWKVAETETAQIVVAQSTWRRLLVVLDKNTLDVLHVAAGHRFSGGWTRVSDVQRADWVG